MQQLPGILNESLQDQKGKIPSSKDTIFITAKKLPTACKLFSGITADKRGLPEQLQLIYISMYIYIK